MSNTRNTATSPVSVRLMERRHSFCVAIVYIIASQVWTSWACVMIRRNVGSRDPQPRRLPLRHRSNYYVGHRVRARAGAQRSPCERRCEFGRRRAVAHRCGRCMQHATPPSTGLMNALKRPHGRPQRHLNGRMGTLEAGLAKTRKLTESLHAAMPLSKMRLVRAPPEPACLVASVPPTPGPPT